VAALTEICPDLDDVVFSGEFAKDRKRAADFAAEAREKKSVSVDPKNRNRAFLLVGSEDWPFPVPLVKRGGKWFFDSKAGRQELLYRRIGANELDAIAICRGFRGSAAGPIDENIARAIEQGYTSAAEPYHGYFFKILKG
jgi:hypothetical protein